MAEQIERVEALPLMTKRKLLGIIIPGINLPLFVFSAYNTVTLYLAGMPTNSEDFISNILVSAATLALGLVLPFMVPVYTSRYTLEEGGLRIRRLLKRGVFLPYKEIVRAEVYIREPGDVPEEALNYTKVSAERLRKSGLGFVDFTNSEANIVLLVSGSKIYMISPAKPRAFLKNLKKRAPKLTARIIELNAKGKNIQELE